MKKFVLAAFLATAAATAANAQVEAGLFGLGAGAVTTVTAGSALIAAVVLVTAGTTVTTGTP